MDMIVLQGLNQNIKLIDFGTQLAKMICHDDCRELIVGANYCVRPVIQELL